MTGRSHLRTDSTSRGGSPASGLHTALKCVLEWGAIAFSERRCQCSANSASPELLPDERDDSGMKSTTAPGLPRWRFLLVAQSCLTLSDPMGCSLPGSSVLGILQARILEGVAISFSRGSFGSRNPTWVPCIAGRCKRRMGSLKPEKLFEVVELR